MPVTLRGNVGPAAAALAHDLRPHHAAMNLHLTTATPRRRLFHLVLHEAKYPPFVTSSRPPWPRLDLRLLCDADVAQYRVGGRLLHLVSLLGDADVGQYRVVGGSSASSSMKQSTLHSSRHVHLGLG